MAEYKVAITVTTNAEAAKKLADGFAEVNRSATEMSAGFETVSAQMANVKTKMLELAGLGSAVFTLKGIVALADEYKNLEAKLHLVTKSQAEFNDLQTKLTAMANTNRQSLSATVDLYSGIAPSLQKAGRSQAEILKAVDSVNKALVVGGSTAVGAAASILQLTQALGSGVLRGDEFNSIMENGRGISQMLADSLGTDTGALRKMAEQGKLTADVVVKALIDQNDAVSKKFATMPITVGQAVQEVKNNLLQAVGDADAYTGATAALSESLIFLSQNLNAVSDIGLAVAAVYSGKMLTSATNYIKTQYDTITAARAQAITDAEAVANKVKEAQATVESTAANVARTEALVIEAKVQRELATEVALYGPQRAQIERELTATTTQHTAALEAQRIAQAELTTAETAAVAPVGILSEASRGLSAIVGGLGGPAGVLMLGVAGLIELKAHLEEEQHTIEDATGAHRDFAAALQAIIDKTDEFKNASDERRKDIRNEMLDNWQSLQQQQKDTMGHINWWKEHQNANPVEKAGYKFANGDLDANLAKFRAITEAIAKLSVSYSETATLMQKDAGTIPLWDSMQKGANAAAGGAKALKDSMDGLNVDWLPNVERYKDEISSASEKFALDAKLIQAVISAESTGNKNAVSPKGAMGLMQLMPANAAETAKKIGLTSYVPGDNSLVSAADNIKLGSAYLKEMYEKYNHNIPLALAAYNAGPGKVDKYGGVPPIDETQKYVEKVLKEYHKLTGETAKEEKAAASEAKKIAKKRAEDIKHHTDEANKITQEDLQKQMQEYKNDLLKREQVAEQYAEKMKALYGADSKEYAAAQRALTDVHKRQAEQRRVLDEALEEANSTRLLAQIDREEALSNQRHQQGIQTVAQTLALEQQFEQRRYQIKMKGLQQRLALENKDIDRNPVAVAKINAQLEQLEQQHQLRLTAIQQKAMIENKRHITDLIHGSTQGIQQSLAGVLSFSTSISDGIRGVFTSVLNAGANMLAEMAAKWIEQQLMQMVYGKATALTQIGANAATAGSGAYAATAMIPIVGPALAPGAAASAYAGAMSFGALASAAGGYDIPAGVNPLTQLHEREMVLPAKHADTIRNLEGGGGDVFHLHINAVDAHSFDRMLRNNGGSLVDALKVQARNFRGLKR